VASLPTTTTGQILQQALLNWGLNLACTLNGLNNATATTAANNVIADVQNALNSSFTVPGSFATNYVPTIPQFSVNPFAQAAEAYYAPIVTKEIATPFNPYLAANLSNAPNVVLDMMELFQAFCTPASSLYLNPNTLSSLLNRVECIMATLYDPTGAAGAMVASFDIAPYIYEIVLLMQKVMPSLLQLTSRYNAWLSNLAANWTATLASSEGSTTVQGYLTNPAAYKNVNWLNSWIRWAVTAAYYSDVLGGNAAYLTLANNGISYLGNDVYADGATTYYSDQNECYNYHDLTAVPARRYWQIYGNINGIANVLAGLQWYYPLCFLNSSTGGRPGVAEYLTAPCWHKYWNENVGGDAMMAVLTLPGATTQNAADPYNLYLALQTLPGPYAQTTSYRVASFYPTTVNPVSTQVPLQFVTYDQNIVGPRSRFADPAGKYDSFAWTATLRSITLENPSPRGKSSIAGTILMDFPSKAYSAAEPLNSAVEDVCSMAITEQYSLLSATDTYYNAKIVNLKANETLNSVYRNAQTTTANFGSASSVHDLSGYSTTISSWQGREIWILTSKRIVGLVRIQAQAAQTAFEVNGRIRLMSGNSSKTNISQVSQLGPQLFRYEGMNINIHAHNYAQIVTELSAGNGGSGQAAHVRLVDWSGSTAPTASQSYPSGTSHYFLVDLYPSSQIGVCCLGILSGLPAGLDGFDLLENDGTHYQIIANQTGNAISYAKPSTAKATYPSGIQYRASWLPQAGLPQTASYTGSIPAYGHVVFQF
jgi:hypothetical protein